MKLHNYFRSSASYRVRIALNLKGLEYDYVSVHIARGDHKKPPYVALSADTLVPLLETDSERLSQSMAIIEYLDETHPEPPLLPADALGRAKVRALAQSIACDIHPLNNLRVLKYLVRELKVDDEAKNTWYRHWCREGLEPLSVNWRSYRSRLIAMVKVRVWLTVALPHRFSMPAVLMSALTVCRARCAPTMPAWHCPLSSWQNLPPVRTASNAD
jgi:maleylacetoacetate isomerase